MQKTASGFSLAAFAARSAQVLLPCALFAALLWAIDTPLIYVLPTLLFFIGIYTWETLRPLHPAQMGVWQRWPANGVMWSLNIVIGSRLGQVFVLLAISHHLSYGSGWVTRTLGTGLLSLMFCVLVLDLWHYLLHRLMHRWSWLWRMHRVHHSDRDFDLTTGLRFHPFEGAITVIWSLIPVLALGMPYAALLANAVLLLWVDYFTHANVQLPSRLEKWTRRVWITPSLHRIHHSLLTPEDRRNYGTTFVFWDQLFGTLQHRSAQPQPVPLTGVEEIAAAQSQGLRHTLLMPFVRLAASANATRIAPAQSD